MGFKLREIEAESKFCRELTLEAIERAVPVGEVQAVLAETGVRTQRERKLNMVVTVFVTIAMNLYSRVSIGEVLRKMAQGLRYIWPDPDYLVANDSAISQRRYQLGARPAGRLVPSGLPAAGHARDAGRLPVRPAPDGHRRHDRRRARHARRMWPPLVVITRHRGDSAFPQVQAVYLAECGTHAIVDAGFWPCHTSERMGGLRMLRSVGRRACWSCGTAAFTTSTWSSGAVDAGPRSWPACPRMSSPQLVRRLPDGSYLATIRPSEYARRKAGRMPARTHHRVHHHRSGTCRTTARAIAC